MNNGVGMISDVDFVMLILFEMVMVFVKYVFIDWIWGYVIFEWINWSWVIFYLVIFVVNGVIVIIINFNYEDGYYFVVGGEYDVNDKFIVCVGVVYEWFLIND